MNIEHKIPDEEEMIHKTIAYRTAFFRDGIELLITLALIAATFVMALSRASDGKGTEYIRAAYNGGYTVVDDDGTETKIPVVLHFTVLSISGAVGFASLAAFVIFFRGKKLSYQISDDRFTVFRSQKKSDVFYYSEITGIAGTERRFFGIRRGFTVTVSSRLKTLTYHIICPNHITFESSLFTDLQKNLRLWQKNHENDKMRLQNPPI